MAQPLVTIVVPAFNKSTVTRACLESLVVSGTVALKPEIIVADDASRDATSGLHRVFPGIRVISNSYNVGFIRNCNRAAAAATGRYIVFLNNDTMVFDGWLDWLLETIEGDPRVGAVGSKVLLPDGKLSEAGLQIGPDGGGFEYGVGDDPDAPRYNYRRDVDCNGGCSLLVRTSLFRAIGGFNELYAPAYMDDFDLGLAVWRRGYACVFQPKSRLVHVNFVSHGASQSERLYRRNRPRFARRFAAELARQPAIDPDRRTESLEAAARHRHGSAPLLIVDTRPFDGGIRRELLALRATGRCVMYAPLTGLFTSARLELQQSGIEVLYAYGKKSLDDAIFESMDIAREVSFPGDALAERYRRDARWPLGLTVVAEREFANA
jgi:GT2 family glycosyltransferase